MFTTPRLWTLACVTFVLGAAAYSRCCAASDAYDDVAMTTSVTVDISLPLLGVAHAGENVTLSCRVAGARSDVVVSWLKSAVGDSGGGVEAGPEEVIAVDADLSEPYTRLGRYEVELVSLNEITLSILTIYLVSAEDSGRIRCSVRDDYSYSPASDFATLQVYKRPSELEFVGYNPGSVLTVTENVPVTDLQCAARRVLPLPLFSVLVHNRSATGQQQLPATKTVANVHCRPPVSISSSAAADRQQRGRASLSKPCPVHYDLDALLTVPPFFAGHRDDGHHVTCSATLPHSNWTPTVTSLVLNVLYKPRFECAHSLLAELGASDVIVSCRLRYNPHPASIYVMWCPAGHEGNLRLDAGNNLVNEYKLDERVVDVKSRKESELLFTIKQVQQSHYVAYHFHAVSDIGASSHDVQLIRSYPSHVTNAEQNLVTTRTTHSASTVDLIYDSQKSSGSRIGSAVFELRLCLVCFYWFIGLCSASDVGKLMLSAFDSSTDILVNSVRST
jgi:hypothetical protein